MRLRSLLSAMAIAGLTAMLPLQAGAVTLGVSLASDTNPFYVAMRSGIEKKAQELGWEVRFVTANESVAAQVSGVEDLVAQGVDGILISPIDAVAAAPAYAAAASQNIPIISVARNAPTPDQTAAVAMDEKQIGADIAATLVGMIDGKGSIAMLAGPSGAATFRNLAQGFEDEIAKHPEITIVMKKELPMTREEGLRVAQDILVAHPDVVAIYGGNDELALGAAQAVAAAGKTGQIAITGLNGIPPALAAVKSGELALTVELNPVVWGDLGVETMARWLAGEHDLTVVNIPHKIITR